MAAGLGSGVGLKRDRRLLLFSEGFSRSLDVVLRMDASPAVSATSEKWTLITQKLQVCGEDGSHCIFAASQSCKAQSLLGSSSWLNWDDRP